MEEIAAEKQYEFAFIGGPLKLTGATGLRPADRRAAPRIGRRLRCRPSTGPGAQRIERDIETLAGPGYTRSEEAIRRYAYTRVPRDARLLRGRAEALGFEISLRPVGTLVAGIARQGARLRHRVALRLQPKRRQVRRDDGRRHRARGLPAERGARPRPAAPAHLVPGGGGVGLRADAAREPDHCPARDRRGARGVPRRSTTGLLGARGGGRLRAVACESIGILDGLTGWIEPTSSRPASSRTPGTAWGSSRRSPATSTPTSSSRAGRPRRRDADGLPARRRPVAARVILEVERLAREVGEGTAGPSVSSSSAGHHRSSPGRGLSLDTRGVVEEGFQAVARGIESFAQERLPSAA